MGVVELLLIFIGLPLAFNQLLHRGNRRLLFPGMWLLALWTCAALARAPEFDWQQLLVLPKLDANLACLLCAKVSATVRSPLQRR